MYDCHFDKKDAINEKTKIQIKPDDKKHQQTDEEQQHQL